MSDYMEKLTAVWILGRCYGPEHNRYHHVQINAIGELTRVNDATRVEQS